MSNRQDMDKGQRDQVKPAKDKESTWKWKGYFNKRIHKNIPTAPVTSFVHAPLTCVWDSIISKDRVVEVVTRHEMDKKRDCLWFAKIVQLAGYMVKVRFIGFTQDEEKEFKHIEKWVHLNYLHQVGFTAEKSLKLIPPIVVTRKLQELSLQVLDDLIGKMSLSPIQDQLLQVISLPKMKMGQRVEVLRREQGVRQMTLGYIRKIIGRRLYVNFWDTRDPKNKGRPGLWCHEGWEFIKVSGWCKTVGLSVAAPQNYNPEPIPEKELLNDVHINKYMSNEINIDKNMVFELVNPLKEGEIVAGKVTKVLKYGYFEYEIITKLSPEEKKMTGESSQFFLHVTSPTIFPCGFCKEMDLPLLLPSDAVEDIVHFSWDKYFAKTGMSPLPLQKYQELARGEELETNFKVGMKLEAVDSELSDMICPATIAQVINPFMIKVRYDGWGADFDTWKSLTSTEIFPVGWCQLFGLDLDPPYDDDVSEEEIEQEEQKEQKEPVEIEEGELVEEEPVKRPKRRTKKRQIIEDDDDEDADLLEILMESTVSVPAKEVSKVAKSSKRTRTTQPKRKAPIKPSKKSKGVVSPAQESAVNSEIDSPPSADIVVEIDSVVPVIQDFVPEVNPEVVPEVVSEPVAQDVDPLALDDDQKIIDPIPVLRIPETGANGRPKRNIKRPTFFGHNAVTRFR